MQQKDKASPCSIYEQFLEGWCWVLSFVLASLHILTYITYVWQQVSSVECCLLSRGKSCFPQTLAAPYTRYNVPNNWFIGIQVRSESCNSCQLTRITNKHIFLCHLFSKWYPATQIVLVVSAKVLRSLPVGFMPPAQHNEWTGTLLCSKEGESTF